MADDDEEVQAKIVGLMTEHRDLDDGITALVQAGMSTQIQVQRLKKRKLMLKDEIIQLQNRLIPDIIA